MRERISDRARLRAIAVRAMRERGLDPDFPPDVLAEVERLPDAPRAASRPEHDLRNRLWCSIDNDDSRDLDQLSVADPNGAGSIRVLVAIADVDSLVRRGS